MKTLKIKADDVQVGDRIKWRSPQDWAEVVCVTSGSADRFICLHIDHRSYLHIDRETTVEVIRP